MRGRVRRVHSEWTDTVVRSTGWELPIDLLSHWLPKVGRSDSLLEPSVSSSTICIPIYVKPTIQFREGSSGRFELTVGPKQTMGKPVRLSLCSDHLGSLISSSSKQSSSNVQCRRVFWTVPWLHPRANTRLILWRRSSPGKSVKSKPTLRVPRACPPFGVTSSLLLVSPSPNPIRSWAFGSPWTKSLCRAFECNVWTWMERFTSHSKAWSTSPQWRMVAFKFGPELSLSLSLPSHF